MTIRNATLSDIPAVAQIHKARFADHLLGHYSNSFIASFYECLAKQAIFLVHFTQQGVDGFVVGGESHTMAACKRGFVKKHLIRCAVETAFHPSIWHLGLLGLLDLRPLHRNASEANANMHDMRLLSIAVDESARGTGAGAALVRAFEAQIRDRCSNYGLTVRKSNRQAIRFYEKLGFLLEEESRRGLALRKHFRISAEDQQ